jgi:hypothetical protein
METLKDKRIINGIDSKNELIRIADIVNFEGPLLTLFEHKKDKTLYLLDWVDRDNTHNRWLVYNCKPNSIDNFIKGKISHYDLFMAKSFFYIVEINAKSEWGNAISVYIDDLPKVYIPQKDVFFEQDDCPNFEKLQTFVSEKLVSFYEKQKKIQTFKITQNSISTKNISSNQFELNILHTKTQNKQFNSIIYTFDKNEITINNQKHKNEYNVSANN